MDIAKVIAKQAKIVSNVSVVYVFALCAAVLYKLS